MQRYQVSCEYRVILEKAQVSCGFSQVELASARFLPNRQSKALILLIVKDIKLENVERLSRGKRSGAHIGSRAVGHHLRPHERSHYRRALEKGYLDITDKDRANLWHIWEKACLAKGCTFLVLIKEPKNALGTIYKENTMLLRLPVDEAKAHIKMLAKSEIV